MLSASPAQMPAWTCNIKKTPVLQEATGVPTPLTHVSRKNDHAWLVGQKDSKTLLVVGVEGGEVEEVASKEYRIATESDVVFKLPEGVASLCVKLFGGEEAEEPEYVDDPDGEEAAPGAGAPIDKETLLAALEASPENAELITELIDFAIEEGEGEHVFEGPPYNRAKEMLEEGRHGGGR